MVRFPGELFATNECLRILDQLEAKTATKLTAVFAAIRQLMTPPDTKKRRIGFGTPKSK